MVSSILARRFRISDAWMSGGQTGEIYRVFHGKKCYEFGIQEASSSPGAYDPKAIKQFTKRDSAKVRARLEQARDSFTFLKSPPTDLTPAKSHLPGAEWIYQDFISTHSILLLERSFRAWSYFDLLAPIG